MALTIADRERMVKWFGSEQAFVDELYNMSRTFIELGYSSKIFAAFYGIDLNKKVVWDGIPLNGRNISKKQFLYLRTNNLNANGLDNAGASILLTYIKDNGGIHRRLKANKFFKELMDLIPLSHIPEYPEDIKAVSIKMVRVNYLAVNG